MEMNIEDFYLITFVILCVVISCGSIGNIISIIVWSKGTRCKTLPIFTYFKILAFCDLLFLLVPGIESLLKYVPGNSIQLRNTNDFWCKFFIFTVHFGVQLSEWITVAMTVECSLAFCFPLLFHSRQHKARCTYIVIALITCVLTGVNIPVSLTSKLTVVSKQEKVLQFCGVQKLQQSTLVTAMIYLSSIGLYIVFPTTIYLVCDLVILVKLYHYQHSTSTYKILTRNLRSVAKLTILINFVHIIANIPVLLTFFIRFDIIELDGTYLWILSVISYGCYVLSHAVNVLLYCFFNKAFWHDFKMLGERFFSSCSRTPYTGDRTETVWNMQRPVKRQIINRDSFWI